MMLPSPRSCPATVTCQNHRPARIAFLCSPPLLFSSGCMSHFAKTWVSLQKTTYYTYISKSTIYFDMLLLVAYYLLLHAPTVQI